MIADLRTLLEVPRLQPVKRIVRERLVTMQAHLAGYTVAILDPEPTSARLIRFRTSVMGSVRSCWSSSGLMCGSRLRSRAPRRIPVATRLAAARTAAGSSQ